MAGLYQRRVGFADRTEARVARQGWRDCDFAPDARLEVIQCIWADRDAHQAQRREADGRGHAPHLAVAALAEG